MGNSLDERISTRKKEIELAYTYLTKSDIRAKEHLKNAIRLSGQIAEIYQKNGNKPLMQKYISEGNVKHLA